MIDLKNYFKRPTFLPKFFPLFAILGTVSEAGITVTAEFERYAVTAGATLPIDIIIDGDDTLPGRQPVPGGLFSAGIRARFPAGAPPVVPLTIHPHLDFDGFSPGASVATTPTTASLRGNVDLRPFPIVHHTTPTIATFTLTPRPNSTGTFSVSLEIPRNSPNETIFIDSHGRDLDSFITFRPFTITVVAPLQIARSADRSSVELTYGTAPNFDHHLEFRTSLNTPWQSLPGTPNNTGKVSIPITARLRFYRLLFSPRP